MIETGSNNILQSIYAYNDKKIYQKPTNGENYS